MKKLSIVLVVFFMLTMIPMKVLGNEPFNETNKISGTFQWLVEGFDWGPRVTKIIINFDDTVNKSDLNNELFSVSANGSDRQVKEVYLSDAFGEKDDALIKGQVVTIELDIVLKGISYDGSPFTYAGGYNNWADPYDHEIILNSNMGQYNEIELTDAGKLTPEADQFQTDGKFTYQDEKYGELTLSYATYAPKEDNGSNPLIIWLHGSGEGGTDPTIPLYGANVTNLISDDIQEIFGGAYILVAQTPDRWLDYDNEEETRYSATLMALIDSYVQSNKDIDVNRIYIGGCSNGGVMTMDMLLRYGDYFAAGYPICMGYQNEWISDEQIEELKTIPIWFTHAINDPSSTNQYETTSKAVYDRLIAAGAKNVHFMAPEDVIDLNGNKLMGHWSWIYVLNNTAKCTLDNCTGGCDDLTIMEWLSLQSKEVSDPTPSNPDSSTASDPDSSSNAIADNSTVSSASNPRTGDSNVYAGTLIVLLLSSAVMCIIKKVLCYQR